MHTFSTLRDPHAVLARLGGTDGFRRGLEVAIVVLLAVQAARLVWLLLPPAPLGAMPLDAAPAARVQPERLAIDAFHPDRGRAVAADTTGLRLFAVRPAAAGGSAILAMRDAPQRAWTVGDEVAPGVDLAEVMPDHVVLDSNGRRSELHFAQPDTPAARTVPMHAASAAAHTVPASAPTTDAPGSAIDSAQLLAEMGLRPELAEGRVTGYTVIPRGDGAVLRQTGLQAGDVLLSVNNEALDPERHAALAETLAGASTLSFTYRRDGQIHSATLQAKTP